MIDLKEWNELDERTIKGKTIDFLKENSNHAFTTKEIAEKLDFKLKTLSSQISNLIKEGIVLRKKIMITNNEKGQKMFDVYYKINDTPLVLSEEEGK